MTETLEKKEKDLCIFSAVSVVPSFELCILTITHSLGGLMLHGWHRGYRCDALALSSWIQIVLGGFEAFQCDIRCKV